MEIYVPNSAHLLNSENMLRRLDFSNPDELVVSFHEKWVSVHPVVLAMIGAIALEARSRGVQPEVYLSGAASMRYFDRMGLFEFLNVDAEISQKEHEPAGRFIPLTQIQNNDELGAFLIDMIPLLHADPAEAEPIKYVVSELVRNVLEHSGSKIGAVLCAQYFSKSDKLALGVADAGRGIFGSMRIHHPVSKPKDAIARALLPGVSGVTPKLGGDEFNAGAGLFFTKAIASSSQNYMTLYSGDALFKLREAKQRNVVYADPNNDNALWLEGLPEWSGTAVGINVSLEDQAIFSAVLSLIRKAYAIDLKAKKKAKYKKPRFV